MGLAVVGGGAMAATVAAVAWWGSAAVEETGPPSPRATAPDTAEVSSTLRVVPDIAGLPIMEARDRLLDAGLGLARVLPTPGPPGVVVRIEPGPGRPLPSGTAVTLYVGVEPDRFVQELDGP
jgi:PASTA domain